MRKKLGFAALAILLGATGCGRKAPGVTASVDAAIDMPPPSQDHVAVDASSASDAASEFVTSDSSRVPEVAPVDAPSEEAEPSPAVVACPADVCAPAIAAPCTVGGSVSSCFYLNAAGSNFDALAMTATASEIGVAWTDIFGETLHFTRFGADLSLLSDSIFHVTLDTSGVSPSGLSVAATPTGWLVVLTTWPSAGGPPQVATLLKLDTSGRLQTTRDVAPSSQVIAGPGGTAILTGANQFQRVDSEGASLGRSGTVPGTLFPGSVGVDDGFVLVSSTSDSFALFHVGTDGTVLAGDTISFQTDASSPAFFHGAFVAPTPTGIRVVSSTFRLTNQGESLDVCFRNATGNGVYVGGADCASGVSSALGAGPMFVAGDGASIVLFDQVDRWTNSDAGPTATELTHLDRKWALALTEQGGDAILATFADLAGVNAQSPIVLERIGVTPQ
jgi:hypothetical protein